MNDNNLLPNAWVKFFAILGAWLAGVELEDVNDVLSTIGSFCAASVGLYAFAQTLVNIRRRKKRNGSIFAKDSDHAPLRKNQKENGKASLKLIGWLGAGGFAVASAFVLSNEGKVNHTYRDPVGILTACVGETDYIVKPGDIVVGARFTDQQCEEALHRSLWVHAEPVIRCTAPAKLTLGQKIAFLDFSFNVGGAKFCGSTMARLAQAGDVAGSCAEFQRWRFAGGVDCRSAQGKRTCGGVWTRRLAEDRMCSGVAL